MANEVGMPIPFGLPRFEVPALAEQLAAVDRELKGQLEISLGSFKGQVDLSDRERLYEAYLAALGFLALGVRSAPVVIPLITGDETMAAHEWVANYAGWLSARGHCRAEAAKKRADLDPVRQ